MKYGYIVLVGVLIFGGTFAIIKLRQPKISNSVTQTVTTTPTVSTAPTPITTPSDLDLLLPFLVSDAASPPKSFGIYPFGIKSSEHPEGHAGFNFEVKKDVHLLAPANMVITSITTPSGRSDERNIHAKVGDYTLEFLRVGALQSSVKVGATVPQGQYFANPALNHSLNVYMFHMGLLDKSNNAVCPDQSFWKPESWKEILDLFSSSISGNGKPFSQPCYSTTPIPYSVRNIE